VAVVQVDTLQVLEHLGPTVQVHLHIYCH